MSPTIKCMLVDAMTLTVIAARVPFHRVPCVEEHIMLDAGNPADGLHLIVRRVEHHVSSVGETTPAPRIYVLEAV